MVEFGIAHKPIRKGDKWHLIGRCVTDIHVGDRFTKFVPIRLVGEAGPENTNFIRDEAIPIDLTIVQITAYRKTFDTWSAGLTAALVLLGDGENLGESGSLCGFEKI
jgi:hypothetical protein